MWSEDLVVGPYSARTMAHQLSCAGPSLGSVPVFGCWGWKLSRRVACRRSRWLHGLEVCCLRRVCTCVEHGYEVALPVMCTIVCGVTHVHPYGRRECQMTRRRKQRAELCCPKYYTYCVTHMSWKSAVEHRRKLESFGEARQHFKARVRRFQSTQWYADRKAPLPRSHTRNRMQKHKIKL
jgi:hypothetical protein